MHASYVPMAALTDEFEGAGNPRLSSCQLIMSGPDSSSIRSSALSAQLR